jgi:hypothetical protein
MTNTTPRPNIFYYSVPKLEKDMTDDELVDEINAAVIYADRCRESGQGIGSKEHVRKRHCELELVKRPGGIDKWNDSLAGSRVA